MRGAGAIGRSWCKALLITATACGATERNESSPNEGGAAVDGGFGATASGASSGGGAGGSGGVPTPITDGSVQCSDLSSTGTFGGEPLVTNHAWFSHAVATSKAPWRASLAWSPIALELRGPAGVTAGPYVEGISLAVDHGYILRAAAPPWRVACVSPPSTLRIINDNDVIDLKLGATVACPGSAGPDALDVCYASNFDSAAERPCSPGVTGTLDGKAATDAPTGSWTGSSDKDSFSLKLAQYEVRVPVANRSADSTETQEFSGGIVAVERDETFDLYCAAGGRVENQRIVLSGLTKVASCDASVKPVESGQVCRWDFTRGPQP